MRMRRIVLAFTLFVLAVNCFPPAAKADLVACVCPDGTLAGCAPDGTGGWVPTGCPTGGSTLPDLTAGNITPTAATVNVAITLSATITNLTSFSTNNSFIDLFQKATDASGSGAVDIGTYANPVMGGNAARTATKSYTFTTTGTFYVRACADKSSNTNTGTITESNENNNCGAWTRIDVFSAGLSLVRNPCTITSGSTCQSQTNGGAEVNLPGAYGNFQNVAGVKVYTFDPIGNAYTGVFFDSATAGAATFANRLVQGVRAGTSVAPSLKLRAFIYVWKYTGLGACVNGLQNRIYKCVRSDGVVGADSDCSLKPKPSGSQACGSCAPNQGQSCTSSPNSCGMTNTGTIQCNGSCSATTPSNSLCPTVVNGACGSANNSTTGSPPSSGLCASGTASGVSQASGAPRWRWTCVGSGTGHTDASCSAKGLSCTAPSTKAWTAYPPYADPNGPYNCNNGQLSSTNPIPDFGNAVYNDPDNTAINNCGIDRWGSASYQCVNGTLSSSPSSASCEVNAEGPC